MRAELGSLLAAVLESPGDLTLRAVYADCLEESGAPVHPMRLEMLRGRPWGHFDRNTRWHDVFPECKALGCHYRMTMWPVYVDDVLARKRQGGGSASGLIFIRGMLSSVTAPTAPWCLEPYLAAARVNPLRLCFRESHIVAGAGHGHGAFVPSHGMDAELFQTMRGEVIRPRYVPKSSLKIIVGRGYPHREEAEADYERALLALARGGKDHV